MERPDLEADNLEIAMQTAAQAWCTEDTKHKVMDPILCTAFARILSGWIGTARQHARNEEYYRGLLDECAKHLGEAVYTQDDGGKSEEPLRAKVPELVAARHLESGAPALRQELAALYKRVKHDPNLVEVAHHLGKACMYLAVTEEPTPEPIQGGAA